MPDYDAGFKIVGRHAGKQLPQLAGLRCDRWEPIVDTLQTTERLADRAFRASCGNEPFVVYMEAYTRWQANAPWNVLSKSGLLSEREHLPTVCLIFILLPAGYRPQGGQFRLQARNRPTQHIWFDEICLWRQEPDAWWEQHPGMMALYPLTHHGKPRRQAVSYAAEAIVSETADHIVRADLLTTLSIFGKLAYPELNVLEIIGREQMKESKFFEEVMEEGRVEQARRDVVQALEVRFGKKAAREFKNALNVVEAERLSHLLRTAIQCRHVADFQRALTETT